MLGSDGGWKGFGVLFESGVDRCGDPGFALINEKLGVGCVFLGVSVWMFFREVA